MDKWILLVLLSISGTLFSQTYTLQPNSILQELDQMDVTTATRFADDIAALAKRSLVREVDTTHREKYRIVYTDRHVNNYDMMIPLTIEFDSIYHVENPELYINAEEVKLFRFDNLKGKFEDIYNAWQWIKQQHSIRTDDRESITEKEKSHFLSMYSNGQIYEFIIKKDTPNLWKIKLEHTE